MSESLLCRFCQVIPPATTKIKGLIRVFVPVAHLLVVFALATAPTPAQFCALAAFLSPAIPDTVATVKVAALAPLESSSKQAISPVKIFVTARLKAATPASALLTLAPPAKAAPTSALKAFALKRRNMSANLLTLYIMPGHLHGFVTVAAPKQHRVHNQHVYAMQPHPLTPVGL